MIRLSLPSFDPRRPVLFNAECSMAGNPEYDRFLTPFNFRTWTDGFTGNIVVNFPPSTVPRGPFTARMPFVAQLELTHPDSLGMTGAEGWFDIVPIGYEWIWIHDLVVSYTPAEQQGDGRADGHYS